MDEEILLQQLRRKQIKRLEASERAEPATLRVKWEMIGSFTLDEGPSNYEWWEHLLFWSLLLLLVMMHILVPFLIVPFLVAKTLDYLAGGYALR